MIIEPKVREYICTTAHPQGCAESVRNQADYACKQGTVNGTKKALIIGCSTGYGLASRICALENCGADTLGIMFERQANGSSVVFRQEDHVFPSASVRLGAARL